MTKVKICGITRWADAKLAVDLGAALLGFVFWENSPRYVTPSSVRAITSRLPENITRVGVFVNTPLREIEPIVEHAQLSAIQVYGDDAVPVSSRYEVIRAVGVQGEETIKNIHLIPKAITVLLDGHDPVKVGGTGRVFDWAVAAAVAKSRRIFLAGGLNAENVREAVRRVNPYGIDVSSGVERVPRQKEQTSLRSFFREALA